LIHAFCPPSPLVSYLAGLLAACGVRGDPSRRQVPIPTEQEPAIVLDKLI